jgi:hypothetical protein
MRASPLSRGSPPTSHPTEIPNPRRRRRHCRCRRTGISALSVLSILSTSAVTTANARPLPISFLDFLYPSWFTPRPSPVQPPRVSSARNAKRATPVAKVATKLVKRDHLSELKVPPKFESADIGWIVAQSWDLHGRHRRSNVRHLIFSISPYFWRYYDRCFYSWTPHCRHMCSISKQPSLNACHLLFLNPPLSL